MRRSVPMQARLEFSGGPFGGPPPVDVQVRAWPLGDEWVLYVWDEPWTRARLVEWLDTSPDVDVMNPDERDELIAARVRNLPEPWGILFEELSVDGLLLCADGVSHASVRGPRDALQAVVELFHDVGALRQLRPIGSVPDLDLGLLTDAEHDAIQAAYDAGYFEVPRDIKLADLADEQETSSAALSTLIRRGLGRLVENYVEDEELAEEGWPRLRFESAPPEYEPPAMEEE